jgi:succinyl-CoA synthetase alpha subunit
MAVIATQDTVALIQGITGEEGTFRAQRMSQYGTRVVAGTSPGKGGTAVHGIPVYDTVAEAMSAHPDINAAVELVPARFAKDAMLEVIASGIRHLIVHAEGIPTQDVMEAKQEAERKGTRIVGPNCPGVISPGICELGGTPHRVFHGPGKIGTISCTGSIQWYISRVISLCGWGQSTFLGIGGDPVKGTTVPEAALLLQDDEQTEAMMLITEIGGGAEFELADLIRSGRVTKPMVAYIYGRTAIPGKRMGHAGAIISSGKDDVRSKAEALREVGVKILTYPWDVAGAFTEFEVRPIDALLHAPIREASVGR